MQEGGFVGTGGGHERLIGWVGSEPGAGCEGQLDGCSNLMRAKEEKKLEGKTEKEEREER